MDDFINDNSSRETLLPEEEVQRLVAVARSRFKHHYAPSSVKVEAGDHFNTNRNVLSSIAELFWGAKLDTLLLNRLASNPPFSFLDPFERTLGMVFAEIKKLPDVNLNFYPISWQSLLHLAQRLSKLPKNMGFHYENQLTQECQIIIPEEIHRNCDIFQHLKPIKNLRLNQRHLQCRIVIPSIVIITLKAFIVQFEKLRDADWSTMIKLLMDAPLESIEDNVNNEVNRLYSGVNHVVIL